MRDPPALSKLDTRRRRRPKERPVTPHLSRSDSWRSPASSFASGLRLRFAPSLGHQCAPPARRRAHLRRRHRDGTPATRRRARRSSTRAKRRHQTVERRAVNGMQPTGLARKPPRKSLRRRDPPSPLRMKQRTRGTSRQPAHARLLLRLRRLLRLRLRRSPSPRTRTRTVRTRRQRSRTRRRAAKSLRHQSRRQVQRLAQLRRQPQAKRPSPSKVRLARIDAHA